MSVSVRQQILDTASELFYRHGVHAVGVDSIVAQAGVAKSSMYRHFRTKDDLIAAYVQSEDDVFWQQWDRVGSPHGDDPHAELIAILTWIGKKIASPGYRGCPQLNISAELPDPKHPARLVATNHKNEMRRRLAALAIDLELSDPAQVGDQLWLLVDGALANHDLIAKRKPTALLILAADAIVASDRDRSH